MSLEERELLTVGEVAERLRVSLATVYQLIATNKIAHLRIGVRRGAIRVRLNDLEIYIASMLNVIEPPKEVENVSHEIIPPVTFKHLRLQ